jgi:hypothetical protein
VRALWLALTLALSPQLAAAQSGVMVDPPPPDPGYVELAHDDPSIPARMQVLLAQTQGVGDRNLPETTEIAPEPIATGDLISVQFEYSRRYADLRIDLPAHSAERFAIARHVVRRGL